MTVTTTNLRSGLYSALCVLVVFLLVSVLNQKEKGGENYDQEHHQQHQQHIPLRRSLLEETETIHQVPSDPLPLPLPLIRPLRLLTLGGSVTWGAGLTLRRHAYPYRLKVDEKFKVTNIAIRGTGSGYPAQCISSILRDEESNPKSDYEPNAPFDVVIFEFSVNGFDNFELLLTRTRQRYPDAILIYVDLWSLSLREKGYRGAFDNTEAIRLVKEAGGHIYHFHNRGSALDFFDFQTITSDELKSVQMSDLFGNDRHHLSYSGHDLVKQKVKEIIDDHAQDIPSNPRLGSWLGGDRCQSWYETGQPSVRITDGGVINEWDKPKHKWAIEVQPKGAILEYMNRSGEAGQFSLQFMSKCNDMFDGRTSKYPPVIVMVSQSADEIQRARQMAESGQLLLQINSRFGSGAVLNNPNDRWSFLSALHSKVQMRQFHVTESRVVGIAHPGHNYIFVYPVTTTEYPFRITSTILCAACTQLGFEG